MYFIGLDIGTTGCKAAVFDEAGACFGRCYEEFDIICRAPGWAEQSPAVMWEAVTHVLKESVAQAKAAGMRAEEVRALSTSVLGEEVMPVDGDYRPLRDAILGMDYRADEETKLLTGRSRRADLQTSPASRRIRWARSPRSCGCAATSRS